ACFDRTPLRTAAEPVRPFISPQGESFHRLYKVLILNSGLLPKCSVLSTLFYLIFIASIVMTANTLDLIFLCGFMGTGKTTIGRELATRLRRPFRDLDKAIEEYAGRSIRSVFDDGGEEAFRNIERICLLDAIDNFRGILSLGG